MDTDGKVAVVTGGAGGIGRAMGEVFGKAGMKVVLADVQPEPLAKTVSALEADGIDVIGVPTDVSIFDSVCALRDAAIAKYGGVHVVCNNAGIGAGAEGPIWEHELRDWEWAIAVNIWGVVHGINAFVPAMLAAGEPGHIVNTSSGNGGISPLPSTPQYAATKAAVVTITECLYGQLADTALSASVLFPGPHMLRTGLFESWRSRPDRFAKTRERKTPYTTVEALEEQMRAAGVQIAYTEPTEVAAATLDAVRNDKFWIHPDNPRTDDALRQRTQSILERSQPDNYLRAVPG
ncbi:MAG TPA: SDR family NAD(P)-dependent oxidoreductase [Mycobacteriales bacterium]|nr:SDR family NAD(P)-dependent oxidoreductase [Mycobacteriales bacterium]HWA67998.1 SDR family NAD(P)-dependent oxidoreductase [Mycobacteriales bacterium]